MEGKVFGRLTVIKLYKKNSNSRKWWECQCSCGNITYPEGSRLRSGETKSCGCFQKEVMLARSAASVIERRRYTRNSYHAMMRRCYKPEDPSYKYYNDIGVCERWRFGEIGKTGWDCFYEDMGPKPTGYSLDRINNAVGYTKENCRWATFKEQMDNRSKRNGEKFKPI